VKVPYLPAQAIAPLPSLGGALIRPRPVMVVRITGPGRAWLRDGLLDTGSDDTVFEDKIAALIGVDLSQAEERDLGIVGRPQPVRCKYAPVQLRITDGLVETYEWTAVVGFVPTRLRYALIGYAGFLQYFDAEFRGDDLHVLLNPNRSFPGVRI
jgi:hypothetical protein